MNDQVIKRIEAYRPNLNKKAWRRIRPVVVRLALRAEPDTTRWAAAITTAVCRYVSWADQKSIPLEDENLLDPSVISWFLGDVEFKSEATRDTYRSAIGRVQAGGSARKPAQSKRHPVAGPYSGAEQAGLLALPGRQSTRASGVRVESLIRLGLGAGAQPGEQRFVKPEHVTERDGLVYVRLGTPTGTQREVTVLQSHGPRLIELARETRKLEHAYMVIGNGSPHSTNSLSHINEGLNGSDLAPKLSASRLRTTWLVTHLRARTPLDLLLGASGEGTVARLAELLIHVPDLEPEVAAVLLARAETDDPGSWLEKAG